MFTNILVSKVCIELLLGKYSNVKVCSSIWFSVH